MPAMVNIKNKSKLIMRLILILYIIHIAVFIFLGSLGSLGGPNTPKWIDYINFIIQSILALSCLIMNIWLFMPSSHCNSKSKIVLLIINIIEITAVISIFLLPMWGEAPTIQF